MRKQKFKKVGLFIIALLFTCFLGTIKINAYSNTINNYNISEKIHFENNFTLDEFLDNVDDDTQIIALIRINDLEYQNFDNVYHNIKVHFQGLYLSKYVSYMSLSYENKSTFLYDYYQYDLIVNNSQIDYMFIRSLNLKQESSENIESEELLFSWEDALEEIGLDENSNDFDIIKNDIKIGILEWNKVSNNQEWLEDFKDNIVFNESVSSEEVSNHGLIVTNIIARLTNPISERMIYVSNIDKNNLLECIDWFCDNNVNLINISMGLCINDDYTKLDELFDSYSKTTNIVFVKSSGNRGINTVSSPGKSVNVITVGGYDMSYEIYEDSSYSSTKRKPTVVAPIINIPSDVGTTGTSFSAPLVTSIIALLMSQYPNKLNNVESVIATVVAGSTKIIKNSSVYTNGYGFGAVNYVNMYNILNQSESLIYLTSANYEKILTIDKLRCIDVFLCTLGYSTNNIENDLSVNTNFNSAGIISIPNFSIKVYDLSTDDLICESDGIDNIYHLKIPNYTNDIIGVKLKIICEESNTYPYAIAIRESDEYSLIIDPEHHKLDSNYDYIYDEHSFLYTENKLICSQCGYFELMDEIVVSDPDRFTNCGSEVLINGGDYRGNTITEGFTRLLYFWGYNVPSLSRLDYNWYTSDENVATVSIYGTVTAMPVNEPTWVTITVKFVDESGEETDICFYKKMLIVPDDREETLIINYNISMRYNERKVLILNSIDFPTTSIVNYEWSVPCQESSVAGVNITKWGTITAIAPGIMYIDGYYKLNSKIKICIKVTVTL